jgi:hypothetical protein
MASVSTPGRGEPKNALSQRGKVTTRCGHCRRYLTIGRLNKLQTAKDGLQLRCKACRSKFASAWYRMWVRGGWPALRGTRWRPNSPLLFYAGQKRQFAPFPKAVHVAKPDFTQPG